MNYASDQMCASALFSWVSVGLSWIHWLGDPLGTRFPLAVPFYRMFRGRGVCLTKLEPRQVYALALISGGISLALSMHIPVSISAVPTLVLPGVSLGLGIVLIMEKICGNRKRIAGENRDALRPSELVDGFKFPRASWDLDIKTKFSVHYLNVKVDTIPIRPSLILSRLGHLNTPTPRVPHYTLVDVASMLIISPAVAISANTASLIISAEAMSGIPGWFGSSLFSTLRNLERPLRTLRPGTGSAMAGLGVYEDLFVAGICYPRLSNPPIDKLHYPLYVISLVVKNIDTYSKIVSPSNIASCLELAPLPDTQNTSSSYIEHRPAARKSWGKQSNTSHCPTSPHIVVPKIEDSLPTYKIPYTPPDIAKGSPTLRNPPAQPWVPFRAPQLSAISTISSTSLSTMIVSLAMCLTH
ncbi:unnamed protein product [Tuber aestivum]|uniref:Uncharacterized protein n=1 Tax=Tuber aestivum TaxID=59557 RepID=A0A292PV18_9PEZI|nr:unnamed protein product [Tuber aestivum]